MQTESEIYLDLGPSRVLIDYNGPTEASSLGDLLERLERHPLDPSFYADFAEQEHGYAVHFHGNFHDLSAVFSVTTDDPEVVEVLLDAIRRNQESPAYQAALASHAGKLHAQMSGARH